MEAENKKPSKWWHGLVMPGILCIIAIMGLLGWFLTIYIFGLAHKPVFFKDGRIVQLVSTQTMPDSGVGVRYFPPPISIPMIQNKEKESEREIIKIAYCLQSLQPKLSIEVAQIIAKHTYKECTDRTISIPMWIALMFTESSLDPMKSSNAGAHGLCQVRYVTWKEQPELLDNGVSSKDKLFWIDLNIKCGTTIFKKFYEASDKKIGVALWRYNSGQPKLPEGKKAFDIEYVAKIMYYTYKATEILAQESTNLHIVSDPEAAADLAIPTAAPAPEVKEKTKKPIKHE